VIQTLLNKIMSETLLEIPGIVLSIKAFPAGLIQY